MGVDHTPAMQQYLDIKDQHRDCIVLFRMGDFYEMFFDDAVIAARELSITLTTRNKNKEDAIPLAGFPYHALATYLGRLISKGYKVAICEQMEDPKTAKGVVKRDVVRIITPGLLAAAENIMTADNVFLAAIHPGEGKLPWGVAFLDLSTGEFYLSAASDLETLSAQLAGVNFREAILREDTRLQMERKDWLFPGEGVLATYVPADYFSPREAETRLKDFFPPEELASLDFAPYQATLSAAGAVLKYVTETQKTNLGHLNRIRWYEREAYLVLDETAKRNLELFSSIIGGAREGSLFHFLDETSTAMGTRMLRWWLNHPLRDPFEINERLSAVEELRNDHLLRAALRRALKGVSDLERLGSRIAMQVASPRDLVALKNSLERLPEVTSLLGELACPQIASARDAIDIMDDLSDLIELAIVDAPPPSLKDGGIIREGFDSELDALLSLVRDGRSGIAALEEKERRRTGIGSLKVGFNNVFGYYIEITKAGAGIIPADYIRKQTLVNAERYINQELKEYEDTVLHARTRMLEREYELFAKLRERLAGEIKRIQTTARCVSRLDVLASLAEVAGKYNYCRPDVDNDSIIEIRDGRHPVVERMPLAEGFVPNDLKLDGDQNRFLVITGPNMAGKSTYIRQVALIVLMAQMGGFVPAKSARIGAVDRIFTRLGAADSLARGQSTFMVEMIEVANILKNATTRSLIILDEVGRGTGTFDGIAIAWAVAEYIHDMNHLKSRTLFATHYHQLTELAITKDGVKNYNIAVRESKNEIIFLRKIVPGGTNRSYGIHVARLAGLPVDAIKRAREILENMETREFDEVGMPAIARRKKAPKRGGQLNLFADDRDALLGALTAQTRRRWPPLMPLAGSKTEKTDDCSDGGTED
ncbi:MAG: DNA mismatch repair protein MutS [Smithellaceae bacterium]|nr:DNA mismatch repair protein MutS [Smithellaceae bacterium]